MAIYKNQIGAASQELLGKTGIGSGQDQGVTQTVKVFVFFFFVVVLCFLRQELKRGAWVIQGCQCCEPLETMLVVS